MCEQVSVYACMHKCVYMCLCVVCVRTLRWLVFMYMLETQNLLINGRLATSFQHIHAKCGCMRAFQSYCGVNVHVLFQDIVASANAPSELKELATAYAKELINVDDLATARESVGPTVAGNVGW